MVAPVDRPRLVRIPSEVFRNHTFDMERDAIVCVGHKCNPSGVYATGLRFNRAEIERAFPPRLWRWYHRLYILTIVLAALFFVARLIFVALR